jgi:hypothetical protein
MFNYKQFGWALAAWSPATEETGAMGHEIESRPGI